jgi:cytochrome c-type biogenesis protein CcmH
VSRGRSLLLPIALCALWALAPAPASAQESDPGRAQDNDSSPGIAAPVPGEGSAEPKTDLADLEDEVMCPICGTALGLSEAPQADRQRAFIRELIAEGRTKDEIKDALVAEYGPAVLAVPRAEGFDLAAWIVPGAAILAAAAAVFLSLRRWRRAGSGKPAPAASALSQAEDERLSADLARYDQ